MELYGRIQASIPAASFYPQLSLETILSERNHIPIKYMKIDLTINAVRNAIL